jgi:hypothetical protein
MREDFWNAKIDHLLILKDIFPGLTAMTSTNSPNQRLSMYISDQDVMKQMVGPYINADFLSQFNMWDGNMTWIYHADVYKKQM